MIEKGFVDWKLVEIGDDGYKFCRISKVVVVNFHFCYYVRLRAEAFYFRERGDRTEIWLININ